MAGPVYNPASATRPGLLTAAQYVQLFGARAPGAVYMADDSTGIPGWRTDAVARLDRDNVFGGNNDFGGGDATFSGNVVVQGPYLGLGDTPVYGLSNVTTGPAFNLYDTYGNPLLTYDANNDGALNAGVPINGTFAGDGGSLASLNASALAFGTVPAARLPTLPYLSTSGGTANGVITATGGFIAGAFGNNGAILLKGTRYDGTTGTIGIQYDAYDRVQFIGTPYASYFNASDSVTFGSGQGVALRFNGHAVQGINFTAAYTGKSQWNFATNAEADNGLLDFTSETNNPTIRVLSGNAVKAQHIGMTHTGSNGLIFCGGDLTLQPGSGIVRMPYVASNNGELVLEQSGDMYGVTRLRLQNRVGLNGALFENAGIGLIDFAFKYAGRGDAALMRIEGRAEFCPTGTAGEFQFYHSNTTDVDVPLRFSKTGLIAAVPATFTSTIAMKNTTAPGVPTGGGVLYVEGGALKFRGSSGTVTPVAPA